MQDVYSVEELARSLALEERVVEAAIARGTLRAARIEDAWRVTQVDVDQWLRSLGSHGMTRSLPRGLGSVLAVCAGLAVLVCGGYWVRANVLPGTTADGLNVVIPYEGMLENNGSPVSGTTSVTFDLWDAPGSPANKVWSSGAVDVTVFNGRFSSVLGASSMAPLPPDVFSAHNELFLEVTVAGQLLDGRQQVLPSPYAIRSAGAANFTTTGNVVVGANLTVAGAVRDAAGKSPFPVGGVYFQLPGQPSPDTLFTGTWADVSADYAGAFFRAAGGNASAFGAGAQADALKAHFHAYGTRTINVAVNEGSAIQGGGSDHGLDRVTNNLGVRGPTDPGSGADVGAVETRPLNHTMRIWKRVS
jgi:excisionase family DNA binding protein